MNVHNISNNNINVNSNALREFFTLHVSAPVQAGRPFEHVLANFAALLRDFASSGINLALAFINEYVAAHARAAAEHYAAAQGNVFSVDEHENLIRLTATIFIAWLYSLVSAQIPNEIDVAAFNFAHARATHRRQHAHV